MRIWRGGLLALTVAAGVAAGTSLAAADGPSGSEWPNIPWRWQGLYGGVHVGSIDAWWDEDVAGGVQLGRNWQLGNVVYGVEGDVSLSGAEGVDWLASLRGRAGYLVTPGILVYGTAGLGLVETEFDGTETDFVYGLGVEGKLTQATTLRLEYLDFTDTEVDLIRVGVNFKLN